MAQNSRSLNNLDMKIYVVLLYLRYNIRNDERKSKDKFR